MQFLARVLAVAAVFCLPSAAGENAQLQASQAREANRIDDAIAFYRKAVALNPRWTEGWWYLGTLLYDRDDYTDAAPAFSQAAALDPKSGTTLVMLGLSEARLQKNSEALRHLQLGRKLGIADDPQLRHVMLYNLALLWLDRANDHGDFENAQDALDELAREGVQSEELTLALGRAVLRVRNPDGDPVLLRAAGTAEALAAQRDKLAPAQAAYQSLVAAAPRTPNVQFAYGKFLLANGYDDQAIAAFQRELETSPDHLLARLGIAGLKSVSDPAGALPFAAEAVKRAPDLPEAHYLLGLALLNTGSVSQSIAELELARRQAPADPKIPFALARAYSRAQRPADAARARTAFLHLKQQSEATHP